MTKSIAAAQRLIVTGLHALSVQWTGVFDFLLSDLSQARLLGWIVLIGRSRTGDAARSKILAIISEVIFGKIVIQELVEAVIGRQHAIEIAEVVLAELTGRIALIFQCTRNRYDLLVHADRRARHANFR